MTIKAADILYDPINDKILVYSGWVVKDKFNQDAYFMLDGSPISNGATNGTIYTIHLAKKYLVKLGNYGEQFV
jgi:hypothetical protein